MIHGLISPEVSQAIGAKGVNSGVITMVHGVNSGVLLWIMVNNVDNREQ